MIEAAQHILAQLSAFTSHLTAIYSHPWLLAWGVVAFVGDLIHDYIKELRQCSAS